MNVMDYLKSLSHEAKVVLAALSGPVFVLCSSKDLLTTLITKPWRESIPEILPAIVGSGALTGTLYNIIPKKTPQTQTEITDTPTAKT